MNTNIRDYLINGLDPNPEQIADAPYMQQLDNWVPSQYGLSRASKIGGTLISLFTNLTGAALPPFGEVYTYANYDTTLVFGGTTIYNNNHALCCSSNGMVFFAKPAMRVSHA